MPASRRTLIILAAVLVVTVALTGVWLASLPQQAMARLARQMTETRGFTLTAQQPRLDYDDGLLLVLDDVSLTRNGDSLAMVNSTSLSLHMGLGALFGFADTRGKLVLQSPVIDLDIGRDAATFPAQDLDVRDGTLRLRDRSRNAAMTLGDVEGTTRLGADGKAKLSFRFVLNDVLTTLDAEFDDAGRFATTGTPADITLAARGKLLSFSGRARFKDSLQLDGQVTAEADGTGDFFSWLGLGLASLSDTGAFQLSAGLSSAGFETTLSALDAQFAETKVAGKATLAVGPLRPRVKAELDAARVSLFAAQSGQNALLSPWSERALPVPDLRAFDADVTLKTPSLQLRGVDLGPTRITYASADGKVEAKIDGRFASTISLQSAGASINATAALHAKDAAPLLQGLLGFDAISGPLDVSLSTSAEGRSVAALVSSLRGKLEFSAQSISLRGIDAPQLLKMPAEGWQAVDTQTTEATNLNMSFTLQEGVATASTAGMAFKDIVVKPTGEIDLLRQAFDVALNPNGNGVDRKLRLLGTFGRPRFVPDAGKPPALRPAAAPEAAAPPAN
jgi:hypothetical protein